MLKLIFKHFLLCQLQHSCGDINAIDCIQSNFFSHSYSQVTCPRCHIQHIRKLIALNDLYYPSTPNFICPKREPTIESVVAGRNPVKHFGYLLLFGAIRSEERRVGKECRSRWSTMRYI